MNSFGTLFRITLWGESHGPQIGVTLDGVPAGLPLAVSDFEADLARRRSGAKGTTPRIENDLPQIVGDRERIEQVVVNILSNAVKYTQQGGEISLDVREVSRSGHSYVKYAFVVKDNGIGMTEETRTKLFTLFFSSKGKGGTGIGLYVARQVVMQHGGRIEVASVKGEGSTFTVTMPRILAK